MVLGQPLVDLPGLESSSKSHDIAVINRRMMSRTISERLHILDTAKVYSRVNFSIVLYLTPFLSQGDPHDLLDHSTPLQIQSHDIDVQISGRYEYNLNADILLLTSYSTKEEVFDSWKPYIQDSLHLEVDVWNVSQRGGLTKADSGLSVLLDYPSRAIVALNDSFSLNGRGTRSIIAFVDAVEVSKLALKNSSVAFFHSPEDLPASTIRSKLAELAHSQMEPLKIVDHYCEEDEELMRQIKIQRGLTGLSQQKTPRRYFVSYLPSLASDLLGKASLDQRGKHLARELRKKSPLDRFAITEKGNGSGLHVQQVLGHGQNICCIEAKPTTSEVSSADFLNAASEYFLVSSLPLPKRLDILYSIDTGVGPTVSEAIQSTARTSIMHELQQYIDQLTSRPRWHHSIFSFKSNQLVTKSMLGDKLSMVLQHRLMKRHGGLQPGSIGYEILSSLILSSRCQTMGQLLRKWLSPFQRTRSHVKRRLVQHAHEALIEGTDPASAQSKNRVKAFQRKVSQRVVKKSRMVEIEFTIGQVTKGEVRHVEDKCVTLDDVFSKSTFLSRDETRRYRDAYAQFKQQQREDHLFTQQLQVELGLTRTGDSSFSHGNAIQEVHAISSSATQTGDIRDGLGSLLIPELNAPPCIQSPILAPQRTYELPQTPLLPDEPPITFESDDDIAELHDSPVREMDAGVWAAELQALFGLSEIGEGRQRAELAAREVAA